MTRQIGFITLKIMPHAFLFGLACDAMGLEMYIGIIGITVCSDMFMRCYKANQALAKKRK